MKYIIFLSALFFLCSVDVQSQSLTAEPVQEHRNNDVHTFPTKSGTVSISNNQFILGEEQIVNPVSWSISEQRNKLSFLQIREMLYLTSLEDGGNTLVETGLEFFDPDDPTLKVFQLSDGRVAIRDNVANFSFIDARGEQLYNISNSSGSPDGERESQLATDRYGRTVVLYNPAIVFGDEMGSRAQLVFGEENAEQFFYDTSRQIKNLNVSEDGDFVTMIVTSNGQDQVYVFDRFGNQLFSVDAEDELNGVSITPNGEYLTIFTSGRMQVYRTVDGERLGSATSQSSVISAYYIPEDETIIAIGGAASNGRINNPSITAVHLGLRQIIREELSLPLAFLESDRVKFIRQGQAQYRLTGLNQDLNLQLQF